MKKNTLISTLVSALISLTVYGQNQTGQSGTTTATTNSSSSSTGNSKSSTDASLSGSATTASGVSFTNKQGQTYSVDKLADELKTLRSTVDQVMPMLQAFNETYSNSVSGDRTLTGRLSGLLSDSLHRNESATSNNNNNSSSTQSSGRYGNVVTALQGLLSKNNPNSPPVSANTVRDLETLYGQLQPVSSTLQNLNVNIGSGASGSSSTNNASGTLTPTGKSSGQQ